mmetsp:Transcript_104692/g.293437  ORF Transcript_104692/g.293437 Transcript_104692/m.293437 type:complete len:213 (-) Transcript_104692:1278-1916(-)
MVDDVVARRRRPDPHRPVDLEREDARARASAKGGAQHRRSPVEEAVGERNLAAREADNGGMEEDYGAASAWRALRGVLGGATGLRGEGLGGGIVSQGGASHAEIRERQAQFPVLSAEVPLLDRHAPLEKVSHPAELSLLPASQRQVVQGDRGLDVPCSKVPLLDLKAPLQQLQASLHISELVVQTCKVHKRGSCLHMTLPEVPLFDRQASLQ